MNILIIRLSSMGDVIHTLPALRAMRTAFPESKLGWVVEDAHAAVLFGLPELDNLYVLPRNRMREGWGGWWSVGAGMKARMREVRWDIAIDFQGLWKSLLVAHWSGAKRVLGYSPSVEHTHWFYSDRVQLPTLDRHAVDRNLDLVSCLGCSVHRAESRSEIHRDFTLPISFADRQAAKALLESLGLPEGSPRILLNFAARKPANQWGVERFARLAALLHQSGMTPILTGGPGDGQLATEIQAKAGVSLPSLVGQCSLMQLAALMEACNALVTGDTGPMHIAVAVGLPVVAVFGPANPIRTGPYSPDAVVLQKPRECQPCYGRICKFNQQPPPCLLDIGAEEVFIKVLDLLSPPD